MGRSWNANHNLLIERNVWYGHSFYTRAGILERPMLIDDTVPPDVLEQTASCLEKFIEAPRGAASAVDGFDTHGRLRSIIRAIVRKGVTESELDEMVFFAGVELSCCFGADVAATIRPLIYAQALSELRNA